jgi:predicted nucleic acid-binding protein
LIFFDSSAAYALADLGDPNHAKARALYEGLPSGQGLLTHNYVVVESFALLQRRMGALAALRAAEDLHRLEVVWVDRDMHAEALARLSRKKRRHASLVDEISFLVMRERGIDTAFAFDSDFEREGFTTLG